MRILHISSAKTFGGGEKHLIDLCRGLTENGHQVFIAIRPTCEWREQLSFLPPENIFTVSIRNSFGLLSSKRIASFVRLNDIEVIHAHLGRDYITASITARLVGSLRCVLTRHVLFPLKPFNRFILTNVDRVIAVSEEVRLSLAGVFENRKVSVINNGSGSPPKTEDERHRLRRIVRSRLGLKENEIAIGVIGTLSEIKGQDLAITMIENLGKPGPQKLFIVGKAGAPKDPFEVNLKRQVGASSRATDVVFIDHIDDVDEFLCGLDILLSSSRSESFGLVVLEAMLAGVPVVSTPSQGSMLLLDKGDCGFISDGFDADSLTKSVVRCLEEESLRDEKRVKAMKRASEVFTLKRMVEKTEAIYREVAGK